MSEWYDEHSGEYHFFSVPNVELTVQDEYEDTELYGPKGEPIKKKNKKVSFGFQGKQT